MTRREALPGKMPLMSRMGTVFLTWRRHLQKGLVPHGITLKQSYLLKQLCRRKFLYPAEVAELLFCDRPTATVVIRNMERQGWVWRAPDPENRKRVRVAITPAGRRKQGSLAKWRAGASFDPLGGLSRAEKGQLEKLLLKVEERLGHIGD
ncbi:MAG: MarR family winged helix-turn-helix transcriptional regulator [Planctomycetota bacterium]